ncbi:hypothetical protein ACE6H2_019041 [Prunus campanulata]
MHERIRFRGVNLSGLDLLKLDLTKIDFSYACLRNVYAEGANFSDASLESSEFVGADLRALTLYLLVPILALQSYKMHSLHDVDLRNASLEGACLVSAQLHDFDLANANLEGASRQRADLKNIKTTTNTKFKDANLQEGAKLGLVTPSGNGVICRPSHFFYY